MLLQLSAESGTFLRSERNFLRDVTLVGQDLGRFMSTICPDIRSLTAENPAKQRTGPEVRYCRSFTHSFVLARFICSTSTSVAPATCLALETDVFPLFEKPVSQVTSIRRIRLRPPTRKTENPSQQSPFAERSPHRSLPAVPASQGHEPLHHQEGPPPCPPEAGTLDTRQSPGHSIDRCGEAREGPRCPPARPALPSPLCRRRSST